MVPIARNEPVLSYAPGSSERAALRAEIMRQRNERIEIASIVGGRSVSSEIRIEYLVRPHDARGVVGGHEAWAELTFLRFARCRLTVSAH